MPSHISIKEKIKLLEQKNSFTRSDFWNCGLGVPRRWESDCSLFRKKATFVPNPRRFSPEEVNLIRSLYSPKQVSYQALATRFGTCKATIDHVINGKGAYREFQRA